MSQQLVPPPWTAGHAAWHCASVVQLPQVPPPELEPELLPELEPELLPELDPELLPELEPELLPEPASSEPPELDPELPPELLAEASRPPSSPQGLLVPESPEPQAATRAKAQATAVTGPSFMGALPSGTGASPASPSCVPFVPRRGAFVAHQCAPKRE